MSGGNLVPTTESDTVVEMKDETITIVLTDEYYEVTVAFTFYNPAETVALSVGFPFFETGIGGNGRIYDFHCWTKEVETDYSDKPSGGLIANYLYGTGSSWKNSIGEITLIIQNDIKYSRPVKITMGDKLITAVFKIGISDILDDTGPKSFPAYFVYTKKTQYMHPMDILMPIMPHRFGENYGSKRA